MRLSAASFSRMARKFAVLNNRGRLTHAAKVEILKLACKMADEKEQTPVVEQKESAEEKTVIDPEKQEFKFGDLVW